jgi:ferric-dicitrate binding protein FerR (iron transport regulator)
MMKGDEMNDEAITRALEVQPKVTIPEGFAARVMASLPAQPMVKARRSVAKIAATAAVAGLIVGLCWMAPHARPSFESVAFDMELLMLCELAGVAAWLSMRRSDG